MYEDERYTDALSDEQKEKINSIIELIDSTENLPYVNNNQIGSILYYEYSGALENDELYACYFQGCLNMDPTESSLTFGLGGDMSNEFNNVHVRDLYSDNALDRVQKALDKVIEMENSNELFIGDYYSDAENESDDTFMVKNSIGKLGIEPIDDITYRLSGHTDEYKEVILDIDEFKTKLANGKTIKYSEAFRYIKLLELVKSIALKRALNKHETQLYGLDLSDISRISSGFAVDNNEVVQYIVLNYTGSKKPVVVKEACRFDINDEDEYYETCNKISKGIYDKMQASLSGSGSLDEIFGAVNDVDEAEKMTMPELFEEMRKHIDITWNIC